MPANARSNLAIRLATAAVGLPVILGVLYVAPAWAFYAMALAAALVGVWEFFSMTHPGDPVARAIGVALAGAASLAVYTFSADARVLLAVMAVVPAAGPLLVLTRVRPIETAALRASAIGFGPLFIGLPLTLLALVRRNYGAGGSGAVLLALGLAWFADTGAYFAGRGFGKHKLYAAVSPNKTVEGSIGGLLASVVWALVASATYLQHRLPFEHAVPLSLTGGLLGQAGDLGESLIKRSAGVKDSGTIVPGHGGVLDRIDAVLMTSTVVFLYVQWAWT
jgi:phosphatidate cytidylyltransferase